MDTFRPSRSQRRALKRAAGVEMAVGPPDFTPEKFELYRRHKQRFERTTAELNLPPDLTRGVEDAEVFEMAFYERFQFTRECTYRVDGKLVGVGLVDVASRLVSSIYFFFDPDHARLSLGTYSALCEIELARDLGVPHYYLGYVVHGNPSMRYKAQFRPNEIFDGVVWRPHRGADGRYVTPPGSTRTQRYPRLID